MSTIQIVAADLNDVPALNQLIQLSAASLSHGFYDATQIDALNHHVFGVDSALIADRSYFKVLRDEQLIACGGWSRRKTLYGGDQRRIGLPELLDPAHDAAKIRAFFVHPAAARQGVGRQLLQHCERCARDNGFTQLELMATLPGVPLYEASGFHAEQHVSDTLPNGIVVTFVRMRKSL